MSRRASALAFMTGFSGFLYLILPPSSQHNKSFKNVPAPLAPFGGESMTIVGFNFTKINVERKSSASGKINVSSNVAIKDVIETDLAIGASKQKAVRFVFEFTTNFEPKVGSILLGGEVLYLQDAKNVEKIMGEWKQGKKVDKDVMTAILNNVLAKCNV